MLLRRYYDNKQQNKVEKQVVIPQPAEKPVDVAEKPKRGRRKKDDAE